MAERDTRVAHGRRTDAIWKQRILSSSCLYPRNSLPFSLLFCTRVHTHTHVHTRARAPPFRFASPSTESPSTMRPTATPTFVVREDGSSGSSRKSILSSRISASFPKRSSRKEKRIYIFLKRNRSIVREIGKKRSRKNQ